MLKFVSSGLSFSCLNDGVQAFKDAVIDLTGLPSNDTIPMVLDSFGSFDNGLKSRVGCPEIPLL